MFKSIFVSFAFLFFFIQQSLASHVMGGEITWTCQGGNYVFELVFYRDCNGAEVNPVSETIRVWNHPTLTQINVPFFSRTDISPTCTPVAGSPPQLLCGTGNESGNGIGAIEKVIYRSAPIALPGTPPAQGWIFTCVNFARSAAITNLVDASNFGITISAYMFPVPGGGAGCIDNSPRFLQDPYLVSCAGTPFMYNMNPIDPDLDSIFVSFGKPLNNFTTGNFTPPTNPIELQFETNFSFLSPTPNQNFNPANIPANINPVTGELTFTSFTTGNFVVKLIVQSFRQGVLIAQVEREIQLVVMNCLPSNNAPIITGPFGGLFETTVTAGELVNFNLTATDVELLQDGTPQSNLLTASGPMFGTNFTQTTGCDIAPCATLNQTPTITGVQGVSTTFNWQTACEHLENEFGNVALEVPYNFVFRVQDNFCQVPKVSYATITIYVKNPGVIAPPAIECIQTLPNNSLQLNWTAVSDPENSFVQYEIHSVQNGLLATIPTAATNSFTVPAINDNHDFFLKVVSGCEGNTVLSSDTVSNIWLELFNPDNGQAILSWNAPSTPLPSSAGNFYHIYREYPAGNWTLFDSVPVNTFQYRDTIDICEVFLNYQVVLPTSGCDFTSNIEGDTFEDMTTPDIPIITAVSIDTLTGNTTITWNVNEEEDTYGYIIYQANENGLLIEIDTVFGINNVTYTFGSETTAGPLVFSVAAFDSCFTDLTPPTYQTSAKGTLHTTMFLTSTYDICNQIATLNWSAYLGWSAVEVYEIYGRIGSGPWMLMGSTTAQQTFNLPLQGLELYTFVIRAVRADGVQSFSNSIVVSAVAPTEPDFHYTRVATVENGLVKILHDLQASGGVAEILIEKKNNEGIFVPLGKVPVVTDEQEFIDTEVDTDRKSYTYRVRIVDSCGNPGAAANEVKTILLSVQTDQLRRTNSLNWSPYSEFKGGVLRYLIYRNYNGVSDPSPLAILDANTFFYEDNVEELDLINGKICYIVEAHEAFNLYGFAEISRSNFVCPVLDPLIYIPNAFTPGGLNPIFKPVISLVDPTDYQFTIVNRWGQIIFQTNDLNQGWDGTLPNSNDVGKTDTYMYVVLVKDGNGQEVSRRGFVTLLK